MPLHTIDDVFEAFRNLKILVIGDVMIDAYSWGTVSRISPEAPVPIVRSTKKEHRLGGAGNVGKNLKALGITPYLVSVTGGGHHFDILSELFEQNGLDAEGLYSSTARPVTVKERVIGNNQQLLRVDAESDHPANEEEEKRILQKIDALIGHTDAVLFEDYDKGTLNQRIIQHTIKVASEKNIPTIVDPKSRNFSYYRQATTFKPNLKELVQGMGLVETPTSEMLPSMLNKLRNDFEFQEVVVTLSAEGIMAVSNDEHHHFRAHKRDIADVSGAGDTVVSVLAATKALRLSLGFATCLANLAGGIVCEQVGVVPVDREKLKAEAAPFINLLK